MHNTKTLFQHGTLALLVPGLFDGTITIKDFMKHGDTGIGTGEGLDGELIVLDGQPYQVNGKGEVIKLSDDFTLPFGNLHFADYRNPVTVENVDKDNLSSTIFKHVNYQNILFSIRMTGTFDTIQARSVKKQTKPYPGLAAVSDQQAIFNGKKQTGTLIGYYAPQVYNGVAVGGFHLHFLSDDHKFGGHVLDFHGFNGQIAFQPFTQIEQSLPVKNENYLKHDFSKDDIAGAIDHAE